MQRWIGPTLGIAAAVTIAIGAFRPAPIVLLASISAVLLLAWLALFAVYLALGGDPEVTNFQLGHDRGALSRPLPTSSSSEGGGWSRRGVTGGVRGDD